MNISGLEAKLRSDYIQLYADEPIAFISAYQYMLDAIKAFDKTQELDRAQEIQDNIIEAYFE